MKKRNILIFGMAGLFSLATMAQQTVTGIVQDRYGIPMKGVALFTVGAPENKVITGENGAFVLKADEGDYIEVRYADGKVRRVWVSDKSVKICLTDVDFLVENRGVEYTEREQTQAVTTISGEALRSNSSPNLTNALNGLFPGLMVKQNTGWTKNASLTVRGGGSLRGAEPLVIVDGIPRPLEYVNGNEVESISVLKDGAATALWGLRGANGVIVVKTKRGLYNTKSVNVNYTFGMGMPINQPKFVDGYTYAQMKNEALYYDGLEPQYNQAALDAFRDGSRPDLYANTNWMSEALRNHTTNHQLNLSFRGGGKSLRYYALVNYKNDQGILNESLTQLSERYDAQMKKYDLNARINLDVDITSSTTATLSMFGLLREENRPRISEGTMFSYLYNTPSAVYPIRTSSGEWGGSLLFPNNPIAEIADIGYYRTDRRLLQSNLRIHQDLSMLAKGLSAELSLAYDNDAVFQETGTQSYVYEQNDLILNPNTGEYEIVTEKKGEDKALSINNNNLNSQYMRTVLEGKIGYDRAFGRHAVNGLLQYWQQSYVPKGRNNSMYRQSYMFAGGYNYDNRYALNVIVNRMGTSVLSRNDKYRTYPSVSAAWILSNESFMKNLQIIDNFKLRASWGRSGNDNIGYELDVRYWESTGGYQFGVTPAGSSGMHAGTLAIEKLDIEIADKYDVGFDLQMLDKRLSLATDFYMDKRRNILVSNSSLYSAVIGAGIPSQCIGAVDTKGLELSLVWRDKVGKNFNYYVGGNFSSMKTEIMENGEGYQPYSYLYKKGNQLGQNYGLEAIGYFNDWDDIKKSPEQTFSDVRPGDIKYKDQNGDNQINEHDVVSIGHSINPGFFYGINLGFEYKGFGIDMLFQGAGQLSRMLNTASVYWPLRNGKSNLSKWYLEDNVRWTEETKNSATLPRLTTLNNANNFRSSTQWLADGSYLKLRNLNIYYNLPQKWIKPMRVNKCQVYVRGNNLFSWDHIDYANCEDISVNYPDLMSVYVGLNINF
ncbi:SusC/RagA family TonB-linked outer membrane protein [Bacteroides neonati]|uniref:SusC/RagA family TonB-linked outer membrane protein n=1 Tax=Bacteroides neonati TaxID=1347393 RepID=UPI0004B0FF55|nr:SusC/RagA family TonB-linked outer membrane protein [Bacteroides neonati]